MSMMSRKSMKSRYGGAGGASKMKSNDVKMAPPRALHLNLWEQLQPTLECGRGIAKLVSPPPAQLSSTDSASGELQLLRLGSARDEMTTGATKAAWNTGCNRTVSPGEFSRRVTQNCWKNTLGKENVGSHLVGNDNVNQFPNGARDKNPADQTHCKTALRETANRSASTNGKSIDMTSDSLLCVHASEFMPKNPPTHSAFHKYHPLSTRTSTEDIMAAIPRSPARSTNSGASNSPRNDPFEKTFTLDAREPALANPGGGGDDDEEEEEFKPRDPLDHIRGNPFLKLQLRESWNAASTSSETSSPTTVSPSSSVTMSVAPVIGEGHAVSAASSSPLTEVNEAHSYWSQIMVHSNKMDAPGPTSLQESTMDVTVPHPKQYQTVLVEGLSVHDATALRLACLDGSPNQASLFRTTIYKMGLRGTYNIALGDQGHSFVLETVCKVSWEQACKLKELFESRGKEGFHRWIAGETGWRFDTQLCNHGREHNWKRFMVTKFNTLQDVFELFAAPDQKYMIVDGKKKLTWRKGGDLTEVVSEIRTWVETLSSSFALTKKLLRNSSKGPDAPLHWAHHHPNNRFPLTVITQDSMSELLEGILALFQKEFGSRNPRLGTAWRYHKYRRQNDWIEATSVDPQWTESTLEALLNGDRRLGMLGKIYM